MPVAENIYMQTFYLIQLINVKLLVSLLILNLPVSFWVKGQNGALATGLYEIIYAPVLVGTPPDNAFNGLVLLPDGEIRHYGFEGDWKKRTKSIYIYSRDNGLKWKTKIINDSVLNTSENELPATKSPYSGVIKGNKVLNPGKWHDVTFEWNNFQTDECILNIDDDEFIKPINKSILNRINYVHFQSTTENEDLNGFLIDAIHASIQHPDIF